MNVRASIVLLLAACGSRTALDVPDASTVKDASPIPPPFDAGVPSIDGSVADVNDEGCPDSGGVFGLLVATDNVLLRFDPVTGFHPLGVLSCNNPVDLSPESMGVARDGTAYVYFAGGGKTASTIYRVNPETLECSPTKYVGGDGERVGMGFTTDEQGPAETLYVLTLTKQLSSLDTTTFDTSAIANEDFNGELAGGGDGRLFSVVFSHTDDPGTRVVELDKKTGDVIASDSLYDLQVGQNLAFFRLGTAFYIFTQGGTSGTTTTVSSYDLPTKTLKLRLFTWPGEIVGAGSSTCASW